MTSVTKYTPWTLVRELQDEVNKLFDRNVLSDKDMSNITTSQWAPNIDIKEEADKFIILADLPGVDPKEIDIAMENNALVIKGERKLEDREEQKNYSRIERFSGTFYRRFVLPNNVDHPMIKANSKHGVLEIIIPKKESETPKKLPFR